MHNYLKTDPWNIVEEGFDPQNQRSSESIFSLGNGKMGQRANFEEHYSGKSLQGNYIAGVYYPDKTKVGWWKNGYPEYFAKVLNAPKWIGLDILIDDEQLDLAKCTVLSFKRILNMREGFLYRNFVVKLPSGREIKAEVWRFLSIVRQEVGAIRYSVTPLNFSGKVSVTSSIDGAVKNADSNYDEYFWDVIAHDISADKGFLLSRTRKTEFDVCIGSQIIPFIDGVEIQVSFESIERSDYVGSVFNYPLEKGRELTVCKYASVLSSLYHDKKKLRMNAEKVLEDAVQIGFESLLEEHKKAWIDKWEHSDIIIKGDEAAQQGIRFNIFQLNQTYNGDDERLNVGPKGFTGEKYGGSTYWDTEAYCLPFFLCTASFRVSRNLLIYRYKHLEKAIQNAHKLGFKDGAALFPMVTMNGEECHNEWEITFEEIHRNGAIAYAIYNYIRHTGDKEYLSEYGLEVLIGISRFWMQRVNFSSEKNKYVMLGVTGPNEYENNVNNNWYTNTIAVWTLKYTLKAIDFVRDAHPDKYSKIIKQCAFSENSETKDWQEIIQNMYFPFDEASGIFIQQDGYMDKVQMRTDELEPSERPINQHWSWDRILRSCFIKQADVLQGIYLFEDQYDTQTIIRNFDFYESRTVHESSLSPCTHAILAARIGKMEKAYQLYLRTSRLDLDDYNNEVHEGLHITSMAGTWMSVVEGFGGKRVRDDKLVLNPQIPDKWESYSFKINFRKSLLKITVSSGEVRIQNESDIAAELLIYGQHFSLSGNKELSVNRKELAYK